MAAGTLATAGAADAADSTVVSSLDLGQFVAWGSDGQGQTFTAPVSGTVSTARLEALNGYGTGAVDFAIQTVDGNDGPNGVLTSTRILGDQIPNQPDAPVTISFSQPATVSAGQHYALTVTGVGGPVATEETNGDFPGGQAVYLYQGAWNPLSSVYGRPRDFLFSVQIDAPDSTPPVITTPGDLSAEATSGQGAAVSYTAPTATDDRDGTVAVTCTPPSGATFHVGSTTVTCTATDTAGNTATRSFGVTVTDTTPPALSPPASTTTDATGPAGATVTYTATAVDLVDGAVTPSCSPPSGSTFAIGTTTVGCTATDAHHNSSTGSFTVTVRGARDQLLSLIASVGSSGPAAPLAAQLQAAVKQVPDSSLPLACTPLRVFTTAVQAMSGKSIPATQAATWIAAATRIRAVLACR